MAQESYTQPPPSGGGANVRLINVTTLVNGVPTTVSMQVIALADESGNVIRDFANYNLQIAMLTELRAIRRILASQSGGFDVVGEGPAIGSIQQ
jgi:hypothetical protein